VLLWRYTVRKLPYLHLTHFSNGVILSSGKEKGMEQKQNASSVSIVWDLIIEESTLGGEGKEGKKRE